MQHECEFCRSSISDTEETCPHCGAPNPHYSRSAVGIPKTIEELKQYAIDHNLPLEQMRFFIGEDFKEPRAFGIYEENGEFIVYKNKDNGSRAIRYKGRDEAYAVNELYQKMHSEIMMRKGKQRGSSGNNNGHYTPPDSNKGKNVANAALGRMIMMVIFVVIIIIVVISQNSGPRDGYYHYDDDYYYYQGSSWYVYDNNNDEWEYAYPDSGLKDHYGDYYDGSTYSSDYGASDFSDSGYYSPDSGNNWDDDWGADDNWDGGTWDAGDTDWGSDW